MKIQFHIKTSTKKNKNYRQTGLYRINLIAANTDAKEIKYALSHPASQGGTFSY